MARKVKSESEKAATPLSDAFFAQPILVESLEHLVSTLMTHGQYEGKLTRRMSLAMISQSATFLMADEFEAYLAEQAAEIRAKLEALNG